MKKLFSALAIIAIFCFSSQVVTAGAKVDKKDATQVVVQNNTVCNTVDILGQTRMVQDIAVISESNVITSTFVQEAILVTTQNTQNTFDQQKLYANTNAQPANADKNDRTGQCIVGYQNFEC